MDETPVQTVVLAERLGIPEDQRLRQRKLRDWWHRLLREHGRYQCYAIFLALPGDLQLRQYLDENIIELHVISGDKCLVIFLCDFWWSTLSPEDPFWSPFLDDHIRKGYSARAASIFAVGFEDLPCLILFRDIRSSDNVRIPLKGLDPDQITESLRRIFAIVQQATAESKDPLAAVEAQRRNEALLRNGKVVVGRLGRLADKTLEAALEVWLKAALQ